MFKYKVGDRVILNTEIKGDKRKVNSHIGVITYCEKNLWGGEDAYLIQIDDEKLNKFCFCHGKKRFIHPYYWSEKEMQLANKNRRIMGE